MTIVLQDIHKGGLIILPKTIQINVRMEVGGPSKSQLFIQKQKVCFSILIGKLSLCI